MTTMRDIAKISDVSVSTVSRVLSGKGRVSDEKRSEILRIIKDLHYIPDYHAKCMVKGGIISVGLVVPDITNPFFSELAKGIESELGNHALLILMDSFRNGEREKELSLALRDNGAKGIIFGNSHVDDDFILEISKFIPTVVFDKEYDLSNVGTIALDNFHGSYMATKHLIENGCSRILHFGGFPDLDVSFQRRLGYEKAMIESNLIPTTILTGYDQDSGYEQAKKIFSSEKYDGVFCMNDLVAVGVMKGLKELGFSIPADVKMVGFDDVNLCEVLVPPLTSVHQPVEEMGKAAVKMLLAMIEKKDTPKKYLFSPSLVVRGSSLKKL
ncbi:LacI family DNA-binding transcriptional regulator [Athalassotoga sp.]|uniref:LacI family DNA-binding transcriptional regulator n=1 Tax=Athalassotoga sp. TaxID=2022597 RepID=UPI003D06D7EB